MNDEQVGMIIKIFCGALGLISLLLAAAMYHYYENPPQKIPKIAKAIDTYRIEFGRLPYIYINIMPVIVIGIIFLLGTIMDFTLALRFIGTPLMVITCGIIWWCYLKYKDRSDSPNLSARAVVGQMMILGIIWTLITLYFIRKFFH